MDVIVVSHARGKTWKLRLDAAHFTLWLPLALILVGTLSLSFALGYAANGGKGLLPEHLMTSWNAEIKAQRAELQRQRDFELVDTLRRLVSQQQQVQVKGPQR